MENFGLYAKYYNLLYKEKDYRAESDYVDGIIKKFTKTYPPQLLNLGCGTGKHDFHFIEKGYHVTGVDLSEGMIDEANEALKKQYPSAKAQFLKGDVRYFKISNKFDAIVSLFHVASYQNSNADILQMMQTAEAHLDEKGVFVFDCWYGPAVLTHRPATRVKRLHNHDISIVRIAEPKMHPNQNLVDVNYEVFIKEKNGTQHSIVEQHTMRYFFIPEISFLLKKAGLKLVASEEWLTGKEPDFSSWNIVFVCKKDI